MDKGITIIIIMILIIIIIILSIIIIIIIITLIQSPCITQGSLVIADTNCIC